MDLKNALPLLSYGASKKNYPFFAPYVLSDGETLTTFNGDVYVKVNCPLPFKGMVNFYVLEGLIKISDSYILNSTDKKLIITSTNSKSELKIVNIEFPEISEPERPSHILSDEEYTALSKAAMFTGDASLENIYISDSCICGASVTSLFYSDVNLPFEKPLGLSRTNLKILSSGLSISGSKSNFVVGFEGGFLLATSFLVDSFPITKIKDLISEVESGCESIMNVAPILDSIKYVTPILSGENVKVLTINNKGYNVTFTATSSINGTSTYEFESESDLEFKINLDINQLKKLDFGYQMYYNKNHSDKVLFKNETSKIIIMGMLGV